MSYEFVRCGICATIYAAKAPPAEALAGAYSEASYDSQEEAQLAADVYMAALEPSLTVEAWRGKALEIGCGNGAFLRALRSHGLQDVLGIEPSRAAAEASLPEVRSSIQLGMFREQDFSPISFNLICCFQTLEHVLEPRVLVNAAYRLLVPGGILVLVTHDYEAWINRILGRHSPIIDIEHTQIFCRKSLEYLLSHAGYEAIRITGLRNRYPIHYWAKLLPIPRFAKGIIGKMLDVTSIGQFIIGLNVGNLLSIAKKPA